MIQELGTERLTEVFNNAQLIPIDANNNTQVGIIKDIFTDTELELIADVFNNGNWTEMPAQAHLGRKQILDFYPVMRLINFIKEILPKINTLMG